MARVRTPTTYDIWIWYLGHSQMVVSGHIVPRGDCRRMANTQPPPRSFGAACPKCGQPMHLIRRGPHPQFGTTFEAQIFLCPACKHEGVRNADSGGAPHE